MSEKNDQGDGRQVENDNQDEGKGMAHHVLHLKTDLTRIKAGNGIVTTDLSNLWSTSSSITRPVQE
jgi:hypothetical protein